MLTLDLKAICKLRGIDRPYSFLVKAGISPQSATKLINSNTRIFRLDHIEIICDKLNCTPNDLLRWKPDNGSTLTDNHSLTKLLRDENSFQLLETLKAIPLEQLNQIATLINQQKTGK
ncbi:MAG: helix-turn-helix transcriptional regulator [Ignavibacteriae bacterium]|nr:helix-turn-helix transcriptional regulator [Ignavibacteriota bacterium]